MTSAPLFKSTTHLPQVTEETVEQPVNLSLGQVKPLLEMMKASMEHLSLKVNSSVPAMNHLRVVLANYLRFLEMCVKAVMVNHLVFLEMCVENVVAVKFQLKVMGLGQ